ncbi:MAG: hypothetical protein GY854_17290, partial [Deltaproteobacteria bacterium]|nr:hypothetical protein [Deltaproteobacteria bacterium]
MQPDGFEDLLAAYWLVRMKESAVNDLFDLSVLADLIVALKAVGRSLSSFAVVESEVLNRLVPRQTSGTRAVATGFSNAVENGPIIGVESDQTLPGRIPGEIPPPPWFPSVFLGSAKWPEDMNDEEL